MNLFDIPAHLPFLDCLAAGVLTEIPPDQPEKLSRVTILLPTRRAARGLRDAFLRAATGEDSRTLLLPRMRALAGLSTEDADELALPALLDLPPAVEPLRRQAVLTESVIRLPPQFGGPGSPEQAWQLAGELGTLLDESALEGCDLERLGEVVPEAHAQHWQVTLVFLRAVIAEWRAWLARHELLDVGERRVLALEAQRREWERTPPEGPVIAAGIGLGTTIPAAAALLRQIARLPQGRVVLHGVDASAEPVWDAIGGAPSHPFCGQVRLLHALDARRDEVKRWPGCAGGANFDVPPERAALLGMALQPPVGLGAWQHREAERWHPGLRNLSLLAAPDAQGEAVAIALLLREALERPGARAALVTPDRDLARRVSAELVRHGIVADDSAGEALAETPAGAFLRLVARMVAEDFAPVPLLSVLKHPLCAGGWDRVRWAAAARLLERVALRGPRPGAGLGGLRAAARATLRVEGASDPEAAARRAARLAEVLALLDTLEAALDRFALPPGEQLPPGDMLAAHLAAAEALASTEHLPGGIRLYAGPEGEPLAAHLAALEPALRTLQPVDATAWPSLFDSTLAGIAARSVRASVGRDGGAHPRVEILGLLEARLLTFDRVVLGALDESVWPLATDPGPWLSRPMRAKFGLPEPEARIGRVAADFCLAACAAPEVILSRAARRDGAPTVPARWLVRLQTFLDGQKDSRGVGLALPASPAASWAAALDLPPGGAARPCARPAPRPPRTARPDQITVTEVATLIADPYAFYARRVLKLRPLAELDADVGAQQYGMLVHDALNRFVRQLETGAGWPGEAAAEAWFAEAAELALRDAGARPGLTAFWRPRLGRIGRFAAEQEKAAREGRTLRRAFTELRGEWPLRRPGGTVTLVARADRIDQLADGSLVIIDYKTGAPPALKAAEDGRAPQLPLEAAMAAEGGFPGVPAGWVSGLRYWRVSGGPVAGEVAPLKWGPEEIEEKAAEVVRQLGTLVDGFLLGNRAFAARPHPGRTAPGGDYDHLARVAEWAGAEDAGPGA